MGQVHRPEQKGGPQQDRRHLMNRRERRLAAQQDQQPRTGVLADRPAALRTLDPRHRAAGNLGAGDRHAGTARDSLRAAPFLDPRHAAAHDDLAIALREQGRLDEAIAAHRRAVTSRPDDPRLASTLLTTLQYAPDCTPREASQAALAWGRDQVAALGPAEQPGPGAVNSDPPSDRPLRVGYVSGDLCADPVGQVLDGVLAAHEPARVESFCYADRSDGDGLTERLRATAGHWRAIAGRDDAAVAGLVRDDAIDILVDLSGHTDRNRLGVFARRPAPIQITWLGTLGTTGLPTIDYILADRTVIARGEEQLYSEAVLRLPDSYLCFTPPDLALDVAPRRGAGGPITFGCRASLSQIMPQVVRLWSEILCAEPDSRLLLKARQVQHAEARDRILRRFAEHGVEAARLELVEPASRADLFGAYKHVDIALDPFPVNGRAATLEALWMGVPVVTLSGDRPVGRVGDSLLSTLGLPELVAHSADGYRAKAVALAGDRARLAELRGELRGRLLASPLGDCAGFTRGLEQAYRAAWRDKARRRGR